MNPKDRLRHHVTGAIERGEKQAIAEIRAEEERGMDEIVRLCGITDQQDAELARLRETNARLLEALNHIYLKSEAWGENPELMPIGRVAALLEIARNAKAAIRAAEEKA